LKHNKNKTLIFDLYQNPYQTFRFRLILFDFDHFRFLPYYFSIFDEDYMVNRHKLILEKLHAHKHMEVLDLCKELNVSAVTIRKDLKFLEQKKLLFRTHGGAALDNPYIADRHVNEKEKINIDQKKAIGLAAANLIKEHQAIILASGTTILSMARAIQTDKKLIAITPAINTASVLLNHTNIEVILLGGNMRHSSSSATGPHAEKMLKDTFCNTLFLGVDGIDFEFGLTTTNMAEASLNQQMIAVSQEIIVLADSGKFGKRGFGRICGVEQINHIITDSGITPETLKKFRDCGIEVTIVDPAQA
jgi:DeoR family transcriptional regulator of aga operon